MTQRKGKESKEKNNIYSSNFLAFWDWYPKKKGKGAAWKAYCSIKKPTPMLSQIREAIETQIKTEDWNDPKFIPHPATWLNQRRWEDEITSINGHSLTAEEILKKHGLTA